MNWDQIVTQSITVLVGGLVVGSLLAWQRVTLDRQTVVRQRKRDIHLARADHLMSLIARIVETRRFGTGIHRFRLAALASKSPDEKNVFKDEIAKMAPLYNSAQSEAIVECEKYGLLPGDSRLVTRQLSAYVDSVLSRDLERSIQSAETTAMRKAWDLIDSLIVDLRDLIEYEEISAAWAMMGKRGAAPPPLLGCLTSFKLPSMPGESSGSESVSESQERS